MLSLVMSPSRRSGRAAKISKELTRQGLPGIRPFTVEVNMSEVVAFTRTAWRESVMATDACDDEKAQLRRQVRFRVAKEKKFEDAVNAQQIARNFSFPAVASRHPAVLESQIAGQGMKLVDKRWDVPSASGHKQKNAVHDQGHKDYYEEVQGRLGWSDQCGETKAVNFVRWKSWGGLTSAEKQSYQFCAMEEPGK